jgi:ferric-dicitrate binding protein FerR (iron transport regulator)
MEREEDIVESLIRSAGRRAEPPEDAYGHVYTIAHEAFRKKTARHRERIRYLWAGAAAVLVFAVALMMRWTPPVAQQDALAQVARAAGEVDVATGDMWRPLAEARARLTPGIKLRTHADGRLALALAGGESLRLAGGTEVMLDEAGRVYVLGGTIYVDSGARPAAARLEIVTPVGTARDLGTQFELAVAGAALRLRVREGMVALDRGGESLRGQAGEQIAIDGVGGVSRSPISPHDPAWQWAEAIAPMPDMDGRPASDLIAWVARETGRRLAYESPLVEQRATAVILHGDIRHLPPMAALEAMLATTDLAVEVKGDTMNIRARSIDTTGP